MRKLRPLSGCLLALACGWGGQALAAPRASIHKWVVDFADHQCVASRNYGSSDKPLYLALKPSPMGDVMQLLIVRKLSSVEPTETPVTIRFDDQKPIKSSMLTFASSKAGTRTNSVNLSLATIEPMRQAKAVSIYANGEIDESFALAQMPPLMSAIDRCVADLRQYWNIGEAHDAKFKERTRCKDNLASYFNDEDYPGVAIANKEAGTVQFALLISETGKIADCMVVATSGVASLDAQTCAILRSRAKFIPAVATDGKPAKDALTGRIRWMLPKE